VNGYLQVSLAFLIMGLIGSLVSWSTAPESALLVIRFVIAGLVLGAIFARRKPLAGIRQPGMLRRLLLMGLVDSASLLLFFVAIRETSVAIGMLLMFLAPLWVAIIAPLVLRSRTERVVYPALALAFAGLCVILWPSLMGSSGRLSTFGLIAGLLGGLGYTAFQLLMKDLTGRLPALTLVFAETWIDALVLLPLALWQTIGSGYALTPRDLVAGLVLGLVCTTLAYMLYTLGMARIKVQHSSILGYLEPVSAPVYAFFLLGQGIPVSTMAGGALVVAAGILVMVFGESEGKAA
jgi:drug/metabolite transporter (DMT)-like permease